MTVVVVVVVFFRSQGREDDHFDDRSAGLFERLASEQPDAASMEMESFQLLDLARVSKVGSRATLMVETIIPQTG